MVGIERNSKGTAVWTKKTSVPLSIFCGKDNDNWRFMLVLGSRTSDEIRENSYEVERDFFTPGGAGGGRYDHVRCMRDKTGPHNTSNSFPMMSIITNDIHNVGRCHSLIFIGRVVRIAISLV
jgi:hypothetical protein